MNGDGAPRSLLLKLHYYCFVVQRGLEKIFSLCSYPCTFLSRSTITSRAIDDVNRATTIKIS
jgi:hypothetical protein